MPRQTTAALWSPEFKGIAGMVCASAPLFPWPHCFFPKVARGQPTLGKAVHSPYALQVSGNRDPGWPGGPLLPPQSRGAKTTQGLTCWRHPEPGSSPLTPTPPFNPAYYSPGPHPSAMQETSQPAGRGVRSRDCGRAEAEVKLRSVPAGVRLSGASLGRAAAWELRVRANRRRRASRVSKPLGSKGFGKRREEKEAGGTRNVASLVFRPPSPISYLFTTMPPLSGGSTKAVRSQGFQPARPSLALGSCSLIQALRLRTPPSAFPASLRGFIPWPRRWQGRGCRPFAAAHSATRRGAQAGPPPTPAPKSPRPVPSCLSQLPSATAPCAPPLRLRLPRKPAGPGGAGCRAGPPPRACLPSQPPGPPAGLRLIRDVSAPTLRPAPWRLWISLGRRACSADSTRTPPAEPRGSERYPRRPPAPASCSRLGAARRAPGGNRNYPRTPHPPRSGCAAPSATCAEPTPPRACVPAAPGAGKSLRASAPGAQPPPPARRAPAAARRHLHPPFPLAFHPCVEIPPTLKKIFFFRDARKRRGRFDHPRVKTQKLNCPERPYLAQRIIYRTSEGVRIRESFLKRQSDEQLHLKSKNDPNFDSFCGLVRIERPIVKQKNNFEFADGGPVKRGQQYETHGD